MMSFANIILIIYGTSLLRLDSWFTTYFYFDFVWCYLQFTWFEILFWMKPENGESRCLVSIWIFFDVIELELLLFFLCVDILLRYDFIWELLIQQYLSHHYFFSLIWITTAMADSGLIILLVLNIWRGLISNSIQAIEKLQPSLYRFLEILGKTRRKSRVSLLLPSHNYTTLRHCVFISI